MSASPTPLKPYVGLIPFYEEDAQFFYGREEEREIITGNLLAKRLTLLYGASGVGKSSVLHAGVGTHLKRLARYNVAQGKAPENVIVIFSSWRDDPLTGLLDAVGKSVASTTNGQVLPPAPATRSLTAALDEWAQRARGQLLIVLDQFEEYFLYHPNEDGKGTFASEFARAVNTLGLPINFLVSFREDSLAKLDYFQGRIPTLYDNLLRIDRLDRNAAREAIKKPLEQYNRLQPTDETKVAIEPALVEEVLKQVRADKKYIGAEGKGVVNVSDADESGNWPIEAPYLQMVMTRLWKEEIEKGGQTLTLSTFHSLGQAEHIVQTHLDATMRDRSRQERKIGASIFHYLVTPSGTKIAQTIPDLVGYGKLREAPLKSLLKELSSGDSRILRVIEAPANQPDFPRYEVFHDKLAEAILEWRRRYLYRRRMERLLIGVGALAIFGLFMSGVSVYALRQRNAAQQQRAQAAQERDRALEAEAKAQDSAAEAFRQKGLAEAQTVLAQTARRDADTQKEIALTQRDAADRARQALAVSTDKLKNTVATLAKTQNDLKRTNDQLKTLTESQQTLIGNLEKAVEAEKAATARAKEQEALAERLLERAEFAYGTVLDIDRANAYYKSVVRAKGTMISASFSADGSRVLTMNRKTQQDLELSAVRVWDVNDQLEPSNQLLPSYEGNTAVYYPGASISPDGKTFVAIKVVADESQRGEVPEVNRKTFSVEIREVGRPEGTADGRGTILAEVTAKDLDGNTLLKNAEFSADGRYLLIHGATFTFCKWDPVNRKLGVCRSLNSPEMNPTWSATLSHNGKFAASANFSGVYLWNAETGKWDDTTQTAQPDLGSANVGITVSFSPDDKYLVTATADDTVRVFDTATGKLVATLMNDHFVSKVAFSPNDGGARLVTANADYTAKVWNLRTKTVIATMVGHEAPIKDVGFSKDGKYVLTASADRTARLWDAQTGRMIAQLRGHTSEVQSVMYSPETDLIFTVGSETARVWDVGGSRSTEIGQDEQTLTAKSYLNFDDSTVQRQIAFSDAGEVHLRYETTGPDSAELRFFNAQVAFLDPATGCTPSQVNEGFEKILPIELEGLNYTAIDSLVWLARKKGTARLRPGAIFAVRTPAGNHAKVKILAIDNERITIRWVTYGKKTPSSKTD